VDLAKVCGIKQVPIDTRALFWHIPLLA
jgi:hypothetical protein